MALIDYNNPDDPTAKEIRREEIFCEVCGQKKPDIMWMGAKRTIYVCAEDAQYLGTQLIKDVRDYEREQGVIVKVRTERVEAPFMKRKETSVDDTVQPEDDIPR